MGMVWVQFHGGSKQFRFFIFYLKLCRQQLLLINEESVSQRIKLAPPIALHQWLLVFFAFILFCESDKFPPLIIKQWINLSHVVYGSYK